MAINREEVLKLEEQWRSERFKGVERPYTAEDVLRLRGSIQIEHT